MATTSGAVASGSSSQTSPSASQVVSEYVVRVPRSNKKKFNVMRFTNSTGIDVTKFGQTSLKMERENNMKDKAQEEEVPKFGAGSEFGREAREEARKKRYSSKKGYKSEDQPWVLKVGGKTGRKYKGIRGGGITENASYYVFMKAPDGAFEAFPVEEWYNFAPIQRYKALSAEEAEEEFGKREKVMNFFSIMLKKRLTLDDKSGEPAEGEENTTEKKGKKKGAKSELKLTDMDEWLSDSDNDSNEDGDKSDDEDGKKKKAAKAQKGRAKKAADKKKKKKKDGSDEEAMEESDEGDFDDREVDYMSDSSTSSEEAPEEKMNKQMKGVEDEEGLSKLNESGDDEEEQKEEKPEEKKEGAAGEETPNAVEKKPDAKAVKAKPEKKTQGSSGDSSAESSDSDFDDSKFNSAMFMQKAKKRGTDSANSSRANTPTKSNGSKSSKRKQQQANNDSNTPLMGAPAAKKIKSEASNTPAMTGSPSEGISEDAVRRYLMRKPMTTTELLQKFKSKRIGISGDQLVTTIAQILKRLNPEKQTIKGKLYLSIKA